MPNIFQAFCSQCFDFRWDCCHFQYFQSECSIYFPKCVHVFRKIDFQFPVKTIDISYPVLGKLISEHGEPSHICINVFWKIWHSVVSIFHKICNQFRIFSVILELAVVFNFFALLYGIWIYLDNTDSA